MDVPDLADHGLAVHLAHVTPSILRLDSPDVKVPRPLMVVAHAETAYPCHHLPMDGEDHLAIQMDPGHL